MANPNVDEFARATARARRQMLNPRGVQTQDQVRNEPTTSELAERLRMQTEQLISTVNKLSRSVSPQGGDDDDRYEDDDPFGNRQPNIRPIRATTSAERNRERGLPRSGNQPASFEEDA
jgi:hypothetical protein